MKQKIILCGLLLIVSIFLFGCEGTLSSDPKERYLAYLEKGEDIKELKIVYKMDFKMLGEAIGSAFDIKIGAFMKDKNEKTVVEMKMMGMTITAYIYNLDGRIITCQKGSGLMMGTSSELSCNTDTSGDLEEMMQMNDFTKITSKLNSDEIIIESKGEKELLGRTCEMFKIEVESFAKLMELGEDDSMNQMLSGGNSEIGEGKVIIDTCIDKKTGVSTEMVISVQSESELVDESSLQEIMGLTAISISDTVDDDVFELPVNYSIMEAACEDDDMVIVVEAFDDISGYAKVNIFDSEYETTKKEVIETIDAGDVTITAGTVMKLDLKKKKKESGYSSSNFELCFGDDCQSSICSSYLSDIDCLRNTNNKAACEADAKCIYQDPLCKEFSCTLLKEDECSANSKCEWEEFGSTGLCSEKSCYTMDEEAECEASELGCKWSTYGCSQISCFDMETQAECINMDICKWENSGCWTDYSK